MSYNSSNFNFRKLKAVILNGFFSRTSKIVSDSKDPNEKLVYSLADRRIPTVTQLKYIGTYLTRAEKMRLLIALSVFVVAFGLLGFRFYSRHLEVVPVAGGEYVEAVVGSPKYINPLYSSINDVDSTIAGLIYSSLYKHSENGKLVRDLVVDEKISQDGKTYELKINPSAKWHNGSSLTTNDILFTFNSVKDSQYKSPLRDGLSGVNAVVVDDQTIKFELKESYSGLRELLTFGVMPAELWGQFNPSAAALAELNLKPVGSGPYKFESLAKYNNGNLRLYSLTVNLDYYGKIPLISELTFGFYSSYEEAQAAVNDGTADGLGFYPSQFTIQEDSKSFVQVKKLSSPQIKAIFFNTKSKVVSETKIRQALNMAFDKNSLVNNNAKDIGSVINTYINPTSDYYSDRYRKYSFNQIEAQKIIEVAGWKLVDVTPDDMAKADELSKSSDVKKKRAGESYKILGPGKWYYKDGDYLIVKLTAADSGDNKNLAEAIQKSWDLIKVKTIVELVPPSQIQGDVIKTRDFEILLAGLIVGADPDPYLYWHSSQIGSDGLNLSSYSNKEVDKIIENARATTDDAKRKSLYERFTTITAEHTPVIYLYSSAYIFEQNNKVKNNNSLVVNSASDRFSGISSWYLKTGSRFKW